MARASEPCVCAQRVGPQPTPHSARRRVPRARPAPTRRTSDSRLPRSSLPGQFLRNLWQHGGTHGLRLDASARCALLAEGLASCLLSAFLAWLPMHDVPVALAAGTETTEGKSQAQERVRTGDDINPYDIAIQQRAAKRKRLFTQDALAAMQRLSMYDQFVAELEEKEAKECLECRKNRFIFEQAWQTVSNEYFDPKGEFSQTWWSQQLVDMSTTQSEALEESFRDRRETYREIGRLIDKLGDRYTTFFTPPDYRRAINRPTSEEARYLEAISTGVGLALQEEAIDKDGVKGGLVVEAVGPATPAEEAGIGRGDCLVSVDGVTPVDSQQAMQLLHGVAGSTVKVQVRKAGSDELMSIAMERRQLTVEPVRSMLILEQASSPANHLRVADVSLDEGPFRSDDGRMFMYLRVHYFNSEARRVLEKKIQEGEVYGVDGYIVDVRNNAGGVYEEAVAIAGLFLEPGTPIASTVRSGDSALRDVVDSEYVTAQLPLATYPPDDFPGFSLTRAPMVLLTNRSSASASEVLAGALRDNHRSAIIGETTFGKGVVQYFFPFMDGSGIRITVEKYLTPSGYDISLQGGIQPDKACSEHPLHDYLDGCIAQAVHDIEKTGRPYRTSSQRVPTSEQ